MASSERTTSNEPRTTPSPQLYATGDGKMRRTVDLIKRKTFTREGWFGDYDYAWLCLPALPFMRSSRGPPPFYALDAELPLVVAIATGLQHALAMLAGLITPPIIFASTLNLDPSTSAYMISASLIGCGILSLVQISRIPLWGGYYLGTGLLSVVGTSFSTLTIANSIFDAMYRDGSCTMTTLADGTTVRDACPDAYGKLLGTSLICSLLEIGYAFLPPRVLKKVFPPMVTGTVILLIGTSLVGSSGAPNWAGGSNGCATATSGTFALCPTVFAPRPLPWGSAEFIGLGFLSFISIVLTEMYGSPFLKNISIIVGLAIGCIVAGAAGYIDGSSIKTAPGITFLWVHTFKIGVYPPAILPMLAVYTSVTMEAIGDITASAEASRVDVQGLEFDSRVQGGILSDGVGGFASALFTVTTLSIFAQNNGVISLTRCANRSAGRWCCVFLIVFGILGKISGALLAIPNPVLGGVTTFLFASVAVSGLRVLSLIQYTRRDRFILGAALSFGIADLLVPNIFTHLFDRVKNPNSGLEGLFQSITIILSTPFLCAGIFAVFLNLVLPQEDNDAAQPNSVDEIEEVEEQKHAAAFVEVNDQR
ncbi:xanthine/uracil permease [Pholiota conissans]|uniref:Xanthine/uracil permease n=1 Tax=Pholiota conissans TaxID=109636 RepID=A0A9P5Z0G8_9AGAR|nr:xanthine/uracil permease [Pholiota conissans]